VLASQRVIYLHSFNEVAALSPAKAATQQFFTWYDRRGMPVDNIHIYNPQAGTVTGSIKVLTGTGAVVVVWSVGPGAEDWFALPAGSIGGPVIVSSSAPVLATQRVLFNDSFNEVAAQAG
jgi:hypothetical protein